MVQRRRQLIGGRIDVAGTVFVRDFRQCELADRDLPSGMVERVVVRLKSQAEPHDRLVRALHLAPDRRNERFLAVALRKAL